MLDKFMVAMPFSVIVLATWSKIALKLDGLAQFANECNSIAKGSNATTGLWRLYEFDIRK